MGLLWRYKWTSQEPQNTNCWEEIGEMVCSQFPHKYECVYTWNKKTVSTRKRLPVWMYICLLHFSVHIYVCVHCIQSIDLCVFNCTAQRVLMMCSSISNKLCLLLLSIHYLVLLDVILWTATKWCILFGLDGVTPSIIPAHEVTTPET